MRHIQTIDAIQAGTKGPVIIYRLGGGGFGAKQGEI